MKGISALALFCEDIRREGGSKDTLIGVMPTTVHVVSFPGALRRLSVYVQIRLATDGKYEKPLSVDLEIAGEKGAIKNENRNPLPIDVIERSLNRAKDRGLPFAVITARMVLGDPVPVPSARKFLAILKYGKRKEVCGLLNIMQKVTDASSASPPPSEQSPPDAPAS
jgi:hypothetical protein